MRTQLKVIENAVIKLSEVNPESQDLLLHLIIVAVLCENAKNEPEVKELLIIFI